MNSDIGTVQAPTVADPQSTHKHTHTHLKSSPCMYGEQPYLPSSTTHYNWHLVNATRNNLTVRDIDI